MQISEETETRIKNNRNLHASTQDGVASAVAIGAGESYIGAFAVFLQSSPFQLALLGALPPFLGALSQYCGVQLMEKVQSRRGLVSVLISLQSSLWLSLSLLPFLFFDSTETAAYGLIGLFSIYHILAGVVAPIWSSLIGDLVPTDIRGTYFGIRNRAALFSAFTALIIAGIVLYYSERNGDTIYGFLSVFLSCALARSFASYWIACHDDPVQHHAHEDKFSLIEFILKIPKSNFGRFVVFIALTHFAMSVANPFFAAYLLGDLQVTYFEFMILIAASMASQFIFMRRWGVLSDLYGNKKILEVSTIGQCLLPGMWLLSNNFWYLLVLHFLGGVFAAGFTLSLGNFLYDAVTPQKRGRCVAFQAIFNGTAILTGSLLGSYLLSNSFYNPQITTVFGDTTSVFFLAFIASSVLRTIVAILTRSMFEEVRAVEPISAGKLTFRVTHIQGGGNLTLRPLYQFSSSASKKARDIFTRKENE